MTEYFPPTYASDRFHCPFQGCGVFAQQLWGDLAYLQQKVPFSVTSRLIGSDRIQGFSVSKCARCLQFSIWRISDQKLVFPVIQATILPNPDLPDDCKVDFEEARSISFNSPRGSAALLRLTIQKLCEDLLKTKIRDLDKAIGQLVEKGLSKKIQKALDTVRVIGNNAVHPGKIDLRDNQEIVNALFGLVNLIAEVMITQEKHVNKLYDSLPPESLEGIERRDENEKKNG